MSLQGISAKPYFGCLSTPAVGVRFGTAEETADAEKNLKETKPPEGQKAEDGFFERLESLMTRVKEFIELFSQAVKTARKGLTDAVKVLRNLPKWEETLKAADPDGKNSALNRLTGVLDVTMAEFRKGYTEASEKTDGEKGDDIANFALYNGVLKRFPNLATMQDNELAKTVLEGALASNPFRPAEEAREALEEMITNPDEEITVSASQIDEALGVPADVTNASRPFESGA